MSEETTPKAWSGAILTLLHKKGDKLDPANYRGIALMNHIGKIFTNILRARLEEWAERTNIIPESQAGFRKGRGCLDNLFTLQSTIQLRISNASNPVFVLFIDFRRAFDSVNHSLLWNKLLSQGVSAKIVRLVKQFYDSASLQIKLDGQLSKEFEIAHGVLQGEILSPLLFVLFIADLDYFFRQQGCEGMFIDGRTDILSLSYADDLAIFAASPADMKRKLKVLESYCDLNKLTVNTAKTKILVCRKAGSISRGLNFKYKKETIEIVPHYEYLGITIASSSSGRKAARAALGKAKMASGAVLSITARAKTSSLDCFGKLFDSITSATLLYAAPI